MAHNQPQLLRLASGVGEVGNDPPADSTQPHSSSEAQQQVATDAFGHLLLQSTLPIIQQNAPCVTPSCFCWCLLQGGSFNVEAQAQSPSQGEH